MICQNCIHSEICKDYSIYKDTIIACEKYKDGTIKNQYDRIRNMSIEELAEKLCGNCARCPLNLTCHTKFVSECKRNLIEYLESEVRE